MLRRRRPLLRAAAVGGGAYMAGKHHAENQAEAEAPAPAAPAYAAPPPPPPPAGGVSDDSIKRLQDLGKLHDEGVLTDDEFAQQKSKVLAG